MISYRALKKLIGETSLERKCRLLFGIALLVLITASFWLYASRTRRLIETQQVIAARMLMPRLLTQRHSARFMERASQDHVQPGTNGSTPQLSTADIMQQAFDAALSESNLEAFSPFWKFVAAKGELPDSDQGFEARRRAGLPSAISVPTPVGV